jgi:hypothetical protein
MRFVVGHVSPPKEAHALPLRLWRSAIRGSRLSVRRSRPPVLGLRPSARGSRSTVRGLRSTVRGRADSTPPAPPPQVFFQRPFRPDNPIPPRASLLTPRVFFISPPASFLSPPVCLLSPSVCFLSPLVSLPISLASLLSPRVSFISLTVSFISPSANLPASHDSFLSTRVCLHAESVSFISSHICLCCSARNVARLFRYPHPSPLHSPSTPLAMSPQATVQVSSAPFRLTVIQSALKSQAPLRRER